MNRLQHAEAAIISARPCVSVQVRCLVRRDMEDVVEIEAASFDSPWTKEDFLTCLRQRNCIGMVAEIADRTSHCDGDIAGFMVYELLKGEMHLLNFAVAPEFRRQCVGAAMVAKLMLKLSQQRRNRIRLEVRETNLAAQLFFRDCGFRASEVVRGYYEDTDEDAYVMQYVLDR